MKMSSLTYLLEWEGSLQPERTLQLHRGSYHSAKVSFKQSYICKLNAMIVMGSSCVILSLDALKEILVVLKLHKKCTIFRNRIGGKKMGGFLW